MPNFIDTDAMQLNAQIVQSKETMESNNTLDRNMPCKEDVNSFEELMNSKEQKAQGYFQNDDPQKQSMQESNDMFSNMTSPLEAFFAGKIDSSMQSSSTESISTPSTIPEDIATNLVDRILVGSPKDGGTEVRISLNNDVLPNTEIQLLRGNDGTLSVKFITGDSNSFQTLVEAQNTLQTKLEAQGERVRINVSSETHQEGNDANQRSQGYMEYNPDYNQEKR